MAIRKRIAQTPDADAEAVAELERLLAAETWKDDPGGREQVEAIVFTYRQVSTYRHVTLQEVIAGRMELESLRRLDAGMAAQRELGQVKRFLGNLFSKRGEWLYRGGRPANVALQQRARAAFVEEMKKSGKVAAATAKAMQAGGFKSRSHILELRKKQRWDDDLQTVR